jgi:lipopolysaccharide/colanic/teichoic acid biosynthesis glycosyltransferase
VKNFIRLLQLALKRLLDIVIASIALAVLGPFLIFIALIIKLTSPGPVFYRWPVVGQGGRPLRAYKFRTMVVGADAMKKDLLAFNEASGPIFKMKSDPRVTPIGRFLRKYSLDELPQLWNVLKGDMSLVGPRPVLGYEWAQFTEEQRQKLSIKPGAVCLWHVSGQPRDLNDWVRLDLEYRDNWSIWLDFKIIIGTIKFMISGKNY